jgi:hypothetical protein
LTFWDILQYKAAPVAVNGSNFGKTIISKYKGYMWDLKYKKHFTQATENFSFCVVSVYTEQSYLPNNGPTKKNFETKP